MPDVQRNKILLVDDSSTIQKVTKKVLERAGYEIDIADNGQDGLNKVSEGNYDLVLLDIRMPRMNGFEVFKRLRADEKTKVLPEIIFYSDYESMEIEGLKHGACDFIPKSHIGEHPKEFVARIEAHLKIASLTRKCIDLEKIRILKATVMSVDHEIRNPLISISLMFERMKKCPDCGSWYDRGKICVQRIVEALEKLSRIKHATTDEIHGKESIVTVAAEKRKNKKSGAASKKKGEKPKNNKSN